MSLRARLEQYAQGIAEVVSATSRYPAGINGPYGDQDTPVRNTAHAAAFMALMYEKTPQGMLRSAAERAVAYLLSDEARPNNAAFLCRTSTKKDGGNGLVGQAWGIEGLACAGRVFNWPDATAAAQKLHEAHRWNDRCGLWEGLSPEGDSSGVHLTLNQQLWFTAVGTMIAGYDQGLSRAHGLLDDLQGMIRLYDDGIIEHNSIVRHCDKRNWFRPGYVPAMVRRFARGLVLKPYHRAQSVGYHGFNLYALALLKDALPGHAFWNALVLSRAMQPLRDLQVMEELQGNRFAPHYNPFGIEAAYALETFASGSDLPQRWLHEQFRTGWYEQPGKALDRPYDRHTASVRIYEACRLRGDYQIARPSI